MVDVSTEITIGRPVAEVAAYARDPTNATHWYANIESSRLLTPPPLAVGSRISFVAHFLGRRLEYTYEVVEMVGDHRFVMRTADGPFAMETTYSWEPLATDATRMTLRNRGQPTGFGAAVALLMGPAIRWANRKDLRRIKAVLEDTH
ncbi:SRPBCC family protein [Gordonia aquimaris]|uniref:SRPBCC family protein n=1 Tax=Gordonia aquimaris TaxID=2984863 RepID=A0A9X3D8A7_9ACTN|nr:SRPBCC family protein [Gordonia aquimaris]MCX2966557.1 SRPBCC family protein [Gordonia aquimaris]